MRASLRPLILATLVAICLPLVTSSRQTESPPPDVISCRVLEVHMSESPAVTAVVFHQRDRADQARLAVLLENLPRETVEMQVDDGKWIGVTVARLKSCFGRGMLFLPTDLPAPKDGSTFALRFSAPADTKTN